VIPTDQEFAALAREVLDAQHYPDVRQAGTATPEQPYDAAGGTLPLQMGVAVDVISRPLPSPFRARLTALGPDPHAPRSPAPYASEKEDAAQFDSVPGKGFDADPVAAAIVPPAGAIGGSGPALAVDPAQNNAFKALNQAWAEGAAVQLANGRYVIQGLVPARQDALSRSLALRMERTAAEGTPIRKPRIATLQPWSPSIDEGWTRWVLEQYGFDVTPLHVDELTASLPNIGTLILADEVRLPIEGMRSVRRQPAPVRPEYADTLGPPDVEALEAFVRRGGTILCLNRASAGVIELLHLPVRDVVAGLPSDAFSVPRSLLEVVTNQDSRLMAGMPSRAAVLADDSPVFEVLEGFEGVVLASYAEEGSLLLSGFLLGDQHLRGHAAALDVELDAGHIILIGFRPQWRGQSFGTLRVLFNGVLR
jgi:hypothetical protein